MKKIFLVGGVFAAALCGCATKSRSIDIAGMFASESGQLAIGKIEAQAIPEGDEAALIRYSEDNAWLQPSMKLRKIGITLTGTNAVGSATGIVESICRAFVSVSSPTNTPAR